MKNMITINMRRFPVLVRDNRTGEERADHITLDKSQLRAAQLVGQSSTELIERLCERQGFTVLEIDTPERRTVALDLEELAKQYQEHQDAKAKWDHLYGGGTE